MKASVYIDLDDVLADSTRLYPEVVGELFNKKADYEDIRSFDLKRSFKLSDKEFTAFFAHIHQDSFLEKIPSLNKADKILEKIHRDFYIDIVTGRPEKSHQASLRWLNKKGFGFDNFLIVDKYKRKKKEDTLSINLEKMSTERYSFAIEDSPDMALYLADIRKLSVFLMDKPWNQGLDHKNIRRIKNWEELDKILDKN